MRRFAAYVIGLLLVLVTAAGCGSGGPAANGGPQPMRVVLPHSSIFTVGLPFAVAQQQGFFARAGIDPQPITTQGGGTSVRAVIAGTADMGVETGPASIMSAVANGAPLKIVAASTTGDDALLFSTAASPIRSLADLSGKKVGYSERGSSTDLNLEAINQLLAAQHLPPAAGAAVGSPTDQLTAVTTGQLDAGWTVPPTFLDKVASGELKIVANGFTEVPALSNSVSRVTFVSEPYLAQHGAQVRAFLQAWQEAWQWSFAHQDEAIKIWKEKDQLTTAPQVLKSAFDYYTPRMLQAMPIDGLAMISDRAAAAKLIPAPLSAEQLAQLVDPGYAPKATS